MTIRVTEFSFLEQFAPRYGIQVPRYIEGNAKRADLKQAIDDWGGFAGGARLGGDPAHGNLSQVRPASKLGTFGGFGGREGESAGGPDAKNRVEFRDPG